MSPSLAVPDVMREKTPLDISRSQMFWLVWLFVVATAARVASGERRIWRYSPDFSATFSSLPDRSRQTIWAARVGLPLQARVPFDETEKLSTKSVAPASFVSGTGSPLSSNFEESNACANNLPSRRYTRWPVGEYVANAA